MEDQWANADNVLQNKFLKNSFYSFTNDFLYPSNIKIYEEKKPRYNDSSLQRTNFASPLALRYIEVPL